jgi:hypothetical protein
VKLISNEFGQVLQLIVMDEVRPPSGVYVPDVYEEIQKRYQFAVKPTDIVEAQKSGAKFQIGKLETKKGNLQIGELGIYNDGLVVNARDTKSAEAMTDDFLDWAIKQFDLRAPQTKIPRQYASSVVVEFDRATDRIIRSFEQISKAYSAVLKELYGWEHELHLTRFSFGIDPRNLPPQRNSLFFIERRTQQPYAGNRWFAGAPIKTETLLSLLETVEKAAWGKS